MKIRAVPELIDFLGQRKQIRKRELMSLSQDLSPPTGEADARIRRASVMLAYAHWEGFVKDAAQAYIRLVSTKSRELSSLAINFQALVCKQELLAAQTATRRIKPHLALTKRFTDDISRSCAIDADTAIDTESNLTAEVFENICLCIGIDYHNSWAREGPFMDDLFRARCEVAHGELCTPDSQYAREIVSFTISAIDRFSTEVENSAVLHRYLR